MNRREFTSIVYDELALDPNNRRANRIIDAADEYAAGQAVRGPERGSTALDHIHMVVKDEAYQRGYEQAKAEYDAKLEEIKSRFKDHYYHKGYKQGEADAAPKWIPVRERTPEEKINPNTSDFDEVLCSTTFGDVRAYKFGTPYGWEKPHFWRGLNLMDEYVLAWMEKPKPWKGEG